MRFSERGDVNSGIQRIRSSTFSYSCSRGIPAMGRPPQPRSWCVVFYGVDVNLSMQLNLPPRSTSTSTSTSSVQAPPTKPTRIVRPGRPLWIISSRRLNSGTEYQVHWNNGRRDSWEPHDSLYRDYPALVNRYSEGRP